MKEGTITIYNFPEKKEDVFEQAKEKVKEMEKAGLVIDELIINFKESLTYQSDPKKGNPQKKR